MVFHRTTAPAAPRRADRDMTEGSIAAHLILFALPLLAGNIFQQLYNTVDSVIVGNFVGKEAFAAIGSSTPVTGMFVNFFSGLAAGAGVLISNHYGAKDKKGLSDAVKTTYTFALILSLIITFAGVLLTPALLKMMNTPEDVFGQASVYLRIYFWGVSGLLLYNTGAGILRAVGDSKSPLYVLIFSTVLNIVLDYIFVKPLAWGVAGAAVATVISQFVSALILFYILSSTQSEYRLDPFRPGICLPELRKITRLGLPTAIQMAVTGFSNVFVLSYINAFGSSCMAGWSAYIRIDSFAVQPIFSMTVAITTFVGQNLGAGRTDRVKKMPLYGLSMAAILLFLTISPVVLFAPWLAGLFGKDPELIEYGTYFIRTLSPFYVFFGINQVYSGILSGKGDTKVCMGIMLFSFVLFRQLYLYTVSAMNLGFVAVSYGYPVGWIMCSLLFVCYYYTKGRNVNRLAK